MKTLSLWLLCIAVFLALVIALARDLNRQYKDNFAYKTRRAYLAGAADTLATMKAEVLKVSSPTTTMVGTAAGTNASDNIAIGNHVTVSNVVAIGLNGYAHHSHSIVIGKNTESTAEFQLSLRMRDGRIARWDLRSDTNACEIYRTGGGIDPGDLFEKIQQR